MIMYLNQSILQLHQIQNYLGKVSGWIIYSALQMIMNDNECLKWCIMRYSHPADHHSTRIRKSDEKLAVKLHFEDIKFPVKIEDIHKVKKRNSHWISVFGYKNKKKIYLSKKSIYQKMI